ncbi:MAG TPA: cryptochrome/photolyase family protein [Candidatus Babeliales bacterium]|nr:cryptochrome/photolyase family protein [Candidatus Babeliales bacterium]
MKNSNSALLILPHQLFEKLELLDQKMPIVIWEAPRYFTDFTFHKQKLIFHHASMQTYADYLKKKKIEVHYCPFNESFPAVLRKQGIKKLHFIDPVDLPFEATLKKMCKKNHIEIEKHETPAFLTSTNIIEKTFGKKNQVFRMQSFYSAQRKRLNILVKNGKPIGGSWSLDKENRKKIPETLTIPQLWKPKKTKFVILAEKYVEKHFSDNPGETDLFCYPTNHADAKKWLDDFLKKRLAHFGDYEDALNDATPFLFHSVLSPLLNAGLLTPAYIIEKTMTYANKHNISLNNLEGFIRQIIGWREYVRGMYCMHGEKQRNSNFFAHKNRLSKSWWNGSTGITPIDRTIKKILSYAYAHHIERLMVLGNYMLLNQTDPNEAYTWFMELFIDAYDWVMVPNVFGMSQFADAGLMMTKPYISSSNYIRSMSSSFKKDEWCQLWDAKYWYFLHKNKKILSKNPRMALVYQQYYRLKPAALKKICATVTSEKK